MKAELLLLLAILGTPADARPRARHSLPAPDELILRALAAPATGYTGQERVQMFRPGAKPRGVTVSVSALPGGLLRRETRMGRRKTAGLISVRDGRTVGLSWPAQKRLWSGPECGEAPEAGLARMRALYQISVSTGGRVAKQATWRVNLAAPGGRVRRSLWVAREGGLLLKSESYRPDGTLARRQRFTKLQIPAEPDASLFRLEPPPGERPAAAFVPGFPRWAPDGFMPVEASAARVLYSDGAAGVSVEVFAARPPLPGKNARVVKVGAREMTISETDTGYGLLARAGGRVYVLSGDIPEDELARMALSMEESR